MVKFTELIFSDIIEKIINTYELVDQTLVFRIHIIITVFLSLINYLY